jgi:glycerophosphoryl diester phosphodiesterase
MNNPPTLSALAGPAWRDFLRARRELFIFEILFKLLEAWLLVPAVALALAAVLAGAGHVAVSNRDVLDFLLTPSGLLYATLLGTVAVASLLLEQAGVMVLAARNDSDQRPPIKQVLRDALPMAWRVIRLSAVQAVLLGLVLLPFVLLAALTYGVFLSAHDIYFYVQVRPPVFWLAAGIGVLLLLAALAVSVVLLVGWSLALPVLLFENRSARTALRASRERVRGVGWRVGSLLVGWLLAALLIGMALQAGFRLFAAAVLANTVERPTVLIVLLLVAQGGLLATWSFATVVGLGLLTRRLYLLRTNCPGVAPGPGKPIAPWNWRLAALTLPIFLVTPLTLWLDLARYTAARPPVQVTAHRGHARAAPENTLSAIRKAIASGADYVEVDAQPTADGVVVLLHDRDLKRVAGDPRRLDELSYAEVRTLDVGSWFDPAFAGERVPTLEEAIHLCRGRVKMNIELKLFGPDRGLARAVARIVREQDFEPDCLVTCFDYDALLEVKRENPRLRRGLIVAHALGDVSRLELDVLSVRADWLSDDLLRAAHRLGREVHVWTVNDPRQMARLMKRGVDNLITSDPDLAIRVRDEWADLTGTERLLLASRLLLGLDP